MSTSRHLTFVPDGPLADVFEQPPRGIAAADPAALIGVGLGAALYTRATEPELARKLTTAASLGATASVVCLEDSIGDHEVEAAEANVIEWLRGLRPGAVDHLPLLFLRPRSPDQLRMIAKELGEHGHALVGLTVPKFHTGNAPAWFEAVDEASSAIGHPLLVMPILEGLEVLAIERRTEELLGLREVLDARRGQVPVIRVGGSDLSGLLGLRRRADQTIYDIGPLRSCISDLVNVLARGDDGFVVSGAVWEYFTGDLRVWKPQLRESLFVDVDDAGDGTDLRQELLDLHLDGLIREVLADQANGLWGKTVIHPSHIRPVNALQVVTYEEWVDARAVADAQAPGAGGGAVKSTFANKMNETAPHRRWADRVLQRADSFGVLREGHSFVSLLED